MKKESNGATKKRRAQRREKIHGLWLFPIFDLEIGDSEDEEMKMAMETGGTTIRFFSLRFSTMKRSGRRGWPEVARGGLGTAGEKKEVGAARVWFNR